MQQPPIYSPAPPNAIPPQPPYRRRQSALGIVSFIFALSIVLFAPAFIISLIDVIRNRPDKKHGLSIAALAISSTAILIIVLVSCGSNGETDPDPTPSNPPVSTTTATTSAGGSSAAGWSSGTTAPPTSSPEELEAAYKASCDAYDYKSILRSPDTYKGKHIVLTVKIAQIMSSSWTEDTWRVYDDEDGSGFFLDNEYVLRDKRSDTSLKILEDDLVTVYGEISDPETFIRAIGWTSVECPCIDVKYIDLYKDQATLIQESAEAIAEALEVAEYSYATSYSRYHLLAVTNTSEYDLKISVSVKYYNEDGQLVGAESDSLNCLEHGFEGLLSFMPDNDYSRTEYTLSVSAPSYQKAAQSDLAVETSQLEDRVVVIVKNTSSETIDSVHVSVLFFSNGELVDFEQEYVDDGLWELSAHASASETFTCSSAFDSFKLFIEGHR